MPLHSTLKPYSLKAHKTGISRTNKELQRCALQWIFSPTLIIESITRIMHHQLKLQHTNRQKASGEKRKLFTFFELFFQLYNISNKKMHNRIAKKHQAKRKKVNRMNGYQENIQGIRFKQMLSMFQQIKLASIFER